MYPQPNNKLNRSRRNSSYSTAEEYCEMFRNLEIFSHKVFVAVCMPYIRNSYAHALPQKTL